LKKIITQQSKNIAAFIYEPLVQGAGGMKMYAADAMNELLSFIKKQQIICIADEVMTGFGRTGKLFASAYIQEPPDIICLSKGLTGGTLPLGITACTKKFMMLMCSLIKEKLFSRALFYGKPAGMQRSAGKPFFTAEEKNTFKN